MAPSPVEADALSELALFEGGSGWELERLAPLLDRKSLPARTNVVGAYEPDGEGYALLEGSAKVERLTS